MHWGVSPWKNDIQLQTRRVLAHMAQVLDENYQAKHRPMDMLERAIALAAFGMSRMIEKRLATDALAARTIEVRSFPARTDCFRSPFHDASGGAAHSNYYFDKP